MFSDFRYAFRQLGKSPGFTTVALLTLALGIGINTSMYGALRALLLRTLPYPDSEQLVRVHRTTPQSARAPHSASNFIDFRAQNQVFEHVAAFEWAGFSLTDPGQPAEWLRGMRVTEDFFPLLRTLPAVGRVFAAEEMQSGRSDTIVLSHGFWTNRYAADPAIVGRQIRLNAESLTVIGVMPPGFEDEMTWGPIDAWRPMAFPDAQLANRSSNSYQVVARLKPGISMEQAQSAISVIAKQLAASYPEANDKSGLRLDLLSHGSQVDDGEITLLIVGLTAFVLLIACANLANLQFARTTARARDHAIRAALGASRIRLIRQILSESLLLAVVGGLLGMLIALWINDELGRRFVLNGKLGLHLPLDLRSLSFTLIVSTVTGLTFGLLPAWFASRIDLNDALKQGSRGTTGARAQHRVRHALIVAEVALALMLLSGAAFFFGGIERLTQRDPGWRVDGLLRGYITISPPVTAKTDQERAAYRSNFTEQLIQRVSEISGVEQVSFGRLLPTWGYGGGTAFAIEGRPESPKGLEPRAVMPSVSPGFFNILRLRLLQGRDFSASDQPDKPAVAVINETMARNLWPGENPLGKRVRAAGGAWCEIVGIVSDARSAADVGEARIPFQLYRPWSQATLGGGTIVVRSSLAPELLAPELRRAAASLDPQLPLRDIDTVRHEIERGVANLKLAGWSLISFAFLGLLLAGIGIYGVIANYVVQRTNEIGIRMALGAQVRNVLTLVLGQGLRLALIGSAIGLVGSLGIGRVFRGIMPALPPADISTSLAAATILLGVALTACWLPAKRATKVNPIDALRAE